MGDTLIISSQRQRSWLVLFFLTLGNFLGLRPKRARPKNWAALRDGLRAFIRIRRHLVWAARQLSGGAPVLCSNSQEGHLSLVPIIRFPFLNRSRIQHRNTAAWAFNF